MKKFILPIFFVFLRSKITFSQQNLVPNPSFEEYSDCPNLVGELYKAFPWKSPTDNTPDFFNICSNQAQTRIPDNIFFNTQSPKNGNGMAGFFSIFENSLSKEYVSVELEETLEVGETYTINFYLILSPLSEIAIKNIAVLLTNSEINQTNYQNISISPQIYNLNDTYFTDTNQWMLFQNIYTASGGERFLTIGHFVPSDLETTSLFLYETLDPSRHAYYAIDEISLNKGNSLNVAEKKTKELAKIQNPIQNKIKLSFNDSFTGEIKLLNELGQEIFMEEINDVKTYSKEVEQLPKGIYFLALKNINNELSTYKMVKL